MNNNNILITAIRVYNNLGAKKYLLLCLFWIVQKISKYKFTVPEGVSRLLSIGLLNEQSKEFSVADVLHEFTKIKYTLEIKAISDEETKKENDYIYMIREIAYYKNGSFFRGFMIPCQEKLQEYIPSEIISEKGNFSTWNYWFIKKAEGG